MTKLFLANLLYNIPHVLVKNKIFRAKNYSVTLSAKAFYFVALHLKLSSAAAGSQLVELFAYENPVAWSSSSATSAHAPSTVVVYQFHNLTSQERLFVYVVGGASDRSSSPKSIAELFANAWWLEREVSELHGLYFEGKKDLRNLMLCYGDSSAPFRKSFPSVGVKEVYYDSFTDQITYVPLSMQI